MITFYADGAPVKTVMTRSEILCELSRIPCGILEPFPNVELIGLCQCEYCNSEVDSTYINCPNCGAPLNRTRQPQMPDLQWNYMGVPVEIVEDET